MFVFRTYTVYIFFLLIFHLSPSGCSIIGALDSCYGTTQEIKHEQTNQPIKKENIESDIWPLRSLSLYGDWVRFSFFFRCSFRTRKIGLLVFYPSDRSIFRKSVIKEVRSVCGEKTIGVVVSFHFTSCIWSGNDPILFYGLREQPHVSLYQLSP